MRRVYFLGSLVGLLAALFAMWAFRFQRSPELPTWRLADLQTAAPPMPGVEWLGSPDRPSLRIKVDSANPRVAVRLAIPRVPAVEGLHLRYRLSARGLTPGAETWEDGRFMIEWHQPDGDSGQENEPVGSTRYDCQNALEDFVVRPLRGPAIPALRLEHLGRSGEFELSDVEITAIEERAVWRAGRWFLALAWLAWGTLWVRSWTGIEGWRALCVSAIWLTMAIYFVIPGPWKVQRAIYPEFQLGGQYVAAPEHAGEWAKTPSTILSGPLPALGKIAAQGDLALRVKLSIARARPLLHSLLLFAPALALALLAGRKPAVVLAVVLALTIELAQVAFGYGFDWIDVFDLASDAIGIALAMWAGKKIGERFERLKVEGRRSKVEEVARPRRRPHVNEE
jgi:hypothetical protein